MRVSVRLSSIFQRFCPAFASLREMELQESSHVVDILQKFGIPQGTAMAIMVNHSMADLNTALKEGDEVEILPLVSGG